MEITTMVTHTKLPTKTTRDTSWTESKIPSSAVTESTGAGWAPSSGCAVSNGPTVLHTSQLQSSSQDSTEDMPKPSPSTCGLSPGGLVSVVLSQLPSTS